MQSDGRLCGETVYGIIKGGFGIHETDSGWSITHVASGWNCFTARYEEGAVIIAHYLIKNYTPDFNRLKVSGTELENYKTLHRKIRSDIELKELIRLFGVSGDVQKKDGQREIELKIIS